MCFHTCDCLAYYPQSLHVANVTDRVDLGHGDFVELPASSYDSSGRVHPDGAILSHGGCLAGQQAGWTFEDSADERCCPGYSFKALTAQEACTLYGLPCVSKIVDGVVNVGMCVKSNPS